MAKKVQPTEPQQANLTPQQLQAAIPKLRRRIAELKEIDLSSIQQRREPRIIALEQKYVDTLGDIFGTGTVEFHRYAIWRLDSHEPSLSETRESYERGIARAVSNLETIVECSKKSSLISMRPRKPPSHVPLKPCRCREIERNAGRLISDGHYANAVEDGCKVLDGLVKIRSGRFDLTGTDLMNTVFSPKSPVLRFNALKTESDRSEQQGMMRLYAGTVLALRNPRAHEIMQDDPEQALDYIGLLSLLAKALDRTERV